MDRSDDQKREFGTEARRFFAVQIKRYLASRPRPRFVSQAEEDAVRDMIRDTWVELRCSGVLDDLSRRGRDALYVTTIIVFPGFVADGQSQSIPVDFPRGQRISPVVPRFSAPLRRNGSY